MCLEIGHDFYCAYQNKWVARSEFNSRLPAYHAPKDSVPYVAAGLGDCKCITCDATDKTRCDKCEMPIKLRNEELKNTLNLGRVSDSRTRCEHCIAQYKLRGKLR